MKFKNAQGQLLYGMHFYPGVAEYKEKGIRIFVNEDTIRRMGPSFAGCPVFVEHVDDDVDLETDSVRNEADGWVFDSFYNEADGKHWVRFVVVSERGHQAVRKGYRLSNCYQPKEFGPAGTWNGVDYNKQMKDGEYEHLALVPNPRYEESVVMTPEQFKAYNEKKVTELKRLANNQEGKGMKLSLFKREPIKNEVDLTATMVVLPKSGREATLETICNEADKAALDAREPRVANGSDMVEYDGAKMMVNEMLGRYKDMCNEVSAMKAKYEKEPAENTENDDDENERVDTDEATVISSKDGKKKNEGDEDDADDKKKKKDKTENSDDDKKKKKDKTENSDDGKKKEPTEDEVKAKREAKEKADKLRNANTKVEETAKVILPQDQVARGKARYGSN